MKASMKTKRGVLGATVLAGVLAIGGYALTNTITFEEARSQAGFGAQDITNVQVTDIDYTLDAVDKSNVTAVVFTISPAILSGAGDANAYMEYEGGTAWIDCGAVADAATTVTCPITGGDTIQDIGEDPTGRTAWVAGAAGAAGTPGTQGTQKPLRLVIAE